MEREEDGRREQRDLGGKARAVATSRARVRRQHAHNAVAGDEQDVDGQLSLRSGRFLQVSVTLLPGALDAITSHSHSNARLYPTHSWILRTTPDIFSYPAALSCPLYHSGLPVRICRHRPGKQAYSAFAIVAAVPLCTLAATTAIIPPSSFLILSTEE